MALEFPDTPFIGQGYDAEGASFKWDGDAWILGQGSGLLDYLGEAFYGATSGTTGIVYPDDARTGDLIVHVCFARSNAGIISQSFGNNFTGQVWQSTQDGSLYCAIGLSYELLTTDRSGAIGNMPNNSNGYSSHLLHFRPNANVTITSVTPRGISSAFSNPSTDTGVLGPLSCDADPPQADFDMVIGGMGAYTGTANIYDVPYPVDVEEGNSGTNLAWAMFNPPADFDFVCDPASNASRKVMAAATLNLKTTVV